MPPQDHEPRHARAFQLLPIELNELIGTYLPTLKDVLSFKSICKETYYAVESDRYTIWRSQYVKTYDVVPGLTSGEMYLSYRIRTECLKKNVFADDDGYEESRCLEALRDIVVESYAGVKLGTDSNNLVVLRRFIRQSGFIRQFMGREWQSERSSIDLSSALLLMFAPWLLQLSLRHRIWGFKFSQQVAYSHPFYTKLFNLSPLVQGSINLKYLLQVLNFFRHHFKSQDERTLLDLFNDLEDSHKPSVWDRSLVTDKVNVLSLGRYWLGAHAYLSKKDVTTLRRLDFNTNKKDRVFPDEVDAQYGFEKFDLDFSQLGNESPWPNTYERLLRAMPDVRFCRFSEISKKRDKIRRTRDSQSPVARPPVRGLNARNQLKSPPISPNTTAPQGVDYDPRQAPRRPDHPITPTSPTFTSPRKHWDYLPFSGTTEHGSDTYSVRGILHDLPDQHNIPGWRRLTMMKQRVYYTSASSDEDEYNNDTTTTNHTSSSSTSPAAPKTTTFTPPSPPSISEEEPIIDAETWAYEGIVLPGGKIIIGRWWSPLEQIAEGFDEDDTPSDPIASAPGIPGIGAGAGAGGRATGSRSERAIKTMRCTGPFLMWNVEEL